MMCWFTNYFGFLHWFFKFSQGRRSRLLQNSQLLMRAQTFAGTEKLFNSLTQSCSEPSAAQVSPRHSEPHTRGWPYRSVLHKLNDLFGPCQQYTTLVSLEVNWMKIEVHEPDYYVHVGYSESASSNVVFLLPQPVWVCNWKSYLSACEWQMAKHEQVALTVWACLVAPFVEISLAGLVECTAKGTWDKLDWAVLVFLSNQIGKTNPPKPHRRHLQELELGPWKKGLRSQQSKRFFKIPSEFVQRISINVLFTGCVLDSIMVKESDAQYVHSFTFWRSWMKQVRGQIAKAQGLKVLGWTMHRLLAEQAMCCARRWFSLSFAR